MNLSVGSRSHKPTQNTYKSSRSAFNVCRGVVQRPWTLARSVRQIVCYPKRGRSIAKTV